MLDTLLPTDLETKQNISSEWFQTLRNQICAEFEKLERDKGSNASFEKKEWSREGGGGGVISVMRGGKVFEKVGVNVSTVYGKFPEQFAKEIPGAAEDPTFWASGISLVAHPRSPKLPIAHMNTRMIVTSKLWFGGGGDLTPIFPIEKDTKDFHSAFKSACDKHDPEYYDKFSKWCDEYFFIKHRNEMRGVGGIFYDNLNTGNWDNDFAFTQDVGMAFRDIYPEILRRHYNEEYTEADVEKQYEKRAKYAEFNLAYDRGTRFGFMTGGNTEAILVSMPPMCGWK